MKTDLTKILSVSGQHGLFRFLAQSKNGAIVESIADGRRTAFDAKSRITSLADISIFTTSGELKLREVFLKLKDAVGGKEYTAKSSPEELKALFAKAVPDYDADRFYVSHMKKVVEWFNDLSAHASLDFEDPEAAEEEKTEENKD